MQKMAGTKGLIRTQIVNGILVVLGGVLAAAVLAITDGARNEAGYKVGMRTACACAVSA